MLFLPAMNCTNIQELVRFTTAKMNQMQTQGIFK
jgi:hypothetical protein